MPTALRVLKPSILLFVVTLMLIACGQQRIQPQGIGVWDQSNWEEASWGQ